MLNIVKFYSNKNAHKLVFSRFRSVNNYSYENKTLCQIIFLSIIRYIHNENTIDFAFLIPELSFLIEKYSFDKYYAGIFLTPKQKIFFLYIKIKSFKLHQIEC